jgi:hypothetical protein
VWPGVTYPLQIAVRFEYGRCFPRASLTEAAYTERKVNESERKQDVSKNGEANEFASANS